VTARRTLIRYVPWAVAAMSVAVLALAAAVGLTTSPSLHVQRLVPSDLGWWVAYAVFSVVGAIVATRRPDHIIGWLMLLAGAVNAVGQGAVSYAVWGLVRHPGSLPGASLGAWVMTFMWTPAIAVIVLVIAYFPNGRLASPRWRWLPWVTAVCTTVIVAVTAVDMWGRRGVREIAQNTDWQQHTASGHVIAVLWPFVPICAIGALASIVVRYRRAGGIERQQLKWLVFAGIVSAPLILVDEVLPASSRFAPTVSLLNSPALGAIAIALAILRYRLYDIDRIVSRTVSYIAVTGVVVGVYVGLVALIETGLGFSSGIAVAASTLAAAAVFQPLRRRTQKAVDRRFDRAAYDARGTVDAFANRLRDEVDVDTISADLVTTVEGAVAPASLTLWLAS
jgi:hypothetical protein